MEFISKELKNGFEILGERDISVQATIILPYMPLAA